MKFLLVAVFILISGCEQNTVIQARYECDGGKVLNATFTDGKEVSVVVDGQTFNIGRAEASSGTMYESESEGISFWSKGIDAFFVAQSGAAPLKCRRR